MSAKAAAKKAPAKPASHPKYIDMAVAAITALAEKKGSSRQAILKYVSANYKVGDNVGTQLKLALKRGVIAAVLTQVKGVGASGSFKVTKKEKVVKPKKVVAAKKPVTKKPKAKTTPKKSPKKTAKPAAKKVVAKKSPAKKTAKKPAAVAKKPAPAAKKPVKKSPAKKAAAKKPAGKGKRGAKAKK